MAPESSSSEASCRSPRSVLPPSQRVQSQKWASMDARVSALNCHGGWSLAGSPDREDVDLGLAVDDDHVARLRGRPRWIEARGVATELSDWDVYLEGDPEGMMAEIPGLVASLPPRSSAKPRTSGGRSRVRGHSRTLAQATG